MRIHFTTGLVVSLDMSKLSLQNIPPKTCEGLFGLWCCAVCIGCDALDGFYALLFCENRGLEVSCHTL